MLRNFNKIVISAFLFLTASAAFAQWNDAHLWTSISIEKKIIKNFSVTVSEELRFSENITELGTFFTDIGLNYKINKHWRVSGDYRFTNKIRLDNSYSKRHRYYFDLSYRKKFYQFSILARTRIQSQYADVNSSETGHLAEYYSRNKLTLKYNITSKIAPYLSAEAFIPLNNPEVKGIDNMRYSLGLEWEFLKNSTLDVFYMIQQQYQAKDPERDFVTGIGYSYSF
ncbi:MAG: DUF2490 domain-containing protein [Bacteroidota bacterium]